MEQVYEVVKLSKITPDTNQPRKFFNAEKMHQLISSIKKEGIISPLIVEKIGDSYLILDGERRYRAATEIGLKEVPVLVEPAGNKIARLTRQFTVQEQHENWAPAEKANALISLSEEIGISLYETCKLLNVSESDVNRYVAFSQLVDRENWIRSEVPVSFAVDLRSLRNAVKRIQEATLKEEFTRSDEKRLEKRVIQSIKDGDVIRRADMSRLRDAFAKNPKLIKKYLESAKETPSSLYLQAEAQGATALRNVIVNARYVRSHGHKFLSNPDVAVTPAQVIELKTARDILGKIIGLAE